MSHISEDTEFIYSQLVSLDLAGQKAFLRHLSIPMRIALWRKNIETFVAGNAILTPEQRDVLATAEAMLDDGRLFFADTDSEGFAEAQRQFTELRRRGEDAFPPHVLHTLFFRLGSLARPPEDE